MNVVAHNLMAANASRQLNIVTKDKQKKTEKLSSGYRINRAADDAAGLAISEKMRWQVRGLDRSAENIQDGVSYCNVAEGALQEIDSMLDRMKELSVQAANDTNTANDRQQIDGEVQQLTKEMDHIFRDTEFNTLKIWGGAYIPSASGNANDFSLYKSDGIDAGIIYGGHRYSWDDLGIGYDKGKGTFTSDFSVDISSLLKNDGSTNIDDDFASASFSLEGKAGQSVSTVQKTYSWKATDTGISIDGIAAKDWGADGNTLWSGVKDASGNAIQSGKNVQPGTYSLNYFGQIISFDVDTEASWDDFVSGINNPKIRLNWHSTVNGAKSAESADVKLKNDSVTITSKNKDAIISSGYNIVADHDTIGIQYKNGKKTTKWQDLPDSSANKISVTSWGDSTGGTAKSDLIGSNDDNGTSKISIDKDSVYGYDDTSDNGVIQFDLKLNPKGSEGSITSDLNSTYISAVTSAPTAIELGTSTATGTAQKAKVSLESSSSSVSFNDQRDNFKRNFDSDSEQIASGSLNADTSGYKVVLSHGNGTLTLTNSNNIKDSIAISIKKAKNRLIDEAAKKSLAAAQKDAEQDIKNTWDADAAKPEADRTISKNQTYDDYFKSQYTDEFIDKFNKHTPPEDGENLGLTIQPYAFTDASGNNKFTIDYDLTSFTYSDVKDLNDDKINDLADQIISGNNQFTLKAAGAATQKLTVNNAAAGESAPTHSAEVTGFVEHLNIQTGALAFQNIPIEYDYLRAANLGLGGINVLTYDSAESAIGMVDHAIDKVSEQRAVFGSYVNRMEHAYNANLNTSENTSAAESRIRDADMSKEMVGYSRDNILQQAGQSVLAQANQQPQGILTLLQ